MDKTDLILDILKEVKENGKEQAKQMAEHRESSLIWKNKTDNRLQRIEVDLKEHKEGVISNRHLITGMTDRLELLEAPTKARKYTYKIVIGIGAVAGAVYTVMRLIGLAI